VRIFSLGEKMQHHGWNIGFILNGVPPKAPAFGRLLAWDAVAQKEEDAVKIQAFIQGTADAIRPKK
jgi:hypothetical protein